MKKLCTFIGLISLLGLSSCIVLKPVGLAVDAAGAAVDGVEAGVKGIAGTTSSDDD